MIVGGGLFPVNNTSTGSFQKRIHQAGCKVTDICPSFVASLLTQRGDTGKKDDEINNH